MRARGSRVQFSDDLARALVRALVTEQVFTTTRSACCGSADAAAGEQLSFDLEGIGLIDAAADVTMEYFTVGSGIGIQDWFSSAAAFSTVSARPRL
jgi:hypothetical protein